MLEIRQKVPDAPLKHVEADGTAHDTDLARLSHDRQIVVFAVPGAFSPTCSKAHLPGYLALSGDFFAKGINDIYCLCVMDFFVMAAWARDQESGRKVAMLADGNGTFTRAAGMEIDLSEAGLGIRSKRYVMRIHDGVIHDLVIEPNVGEARQTSAQAFLERL